MSKEQNEVSGFEAGVAWCTFLLVVFFNLKVLGIVSWSWWWVFSPCWIPLVGLSWAVAIGALLDKLRSRESS